MAVSYTYDTLRTNLINTTEDQGTEFAAALDNIIALAETRILRDLDVEFFDAVTTGTFAASNPLLTKPANFISLRTMHYTDGSSNFNLIESKSWEYVKDYWPNVATTTSTPKYMADYSETQWYLAGTPASNLAYTVRYIVRPTGLSSGTPSTWLSANVGDLLFYACLVSSEAFLKADERVKMWASEYATRLQIVRMELRREKRDDYAPLTPAPDA